MVGIIPFAGAGALLEASGTTLEKKVLKKRKIHYKDFIVWHFFAIILIMLIFIYFFWHMDSAALSPFNLFILALVVFSSIAANIFIFYAVKWEKITNLEPLRLFQPLFVILLAFILYSSERTKPLSIIIPALIAALALIISHVKKHHLSLNKFMLSALAGSFFFALELVISRKILPFYNPISFYLVRSALVFLAVLFIFRSKPTSIDKKSWIYLFMIGAIWVVYRILVYYGYMAEGIGIIFTTLLFILAHVFIYIFAVIFLKEKLKWKNIISAIVIALCVAYAIIQT